MKFTFLFFFNFLLVSCIYGQIAVNTKGVIYAKEFSKSIALYNAKTFVINDVLGQSDEVVKFEVDPLAASTSGELTTLVYKCESKSKEGLILGFYGLRWNESGINYQAYTFKDLPVVKANELLNKIEKVIDDNYKYINADEDNNNIYFIYEDITVLIYYSALGTKLRLYWNGFDSEWELATFTKTKKRLAKKLK